MRKTLLVVSTLVLLMAVAGPLVIGMQLEKATLESRQQLADSLPPWAELVELEYQRGWFGAISQYRVLISEQAPPQVKELIGSFGGFGDQPALVVINSIQHGPIVGLLQPALAEAESTFALDNGSDPLTPLPAVTLTKVGLTGNLQVDWKAAAGRISNEAREFSWEDLSGRIRIKPDLSRLHAEVQSPTLRLTDTTATTRLHLQDIDVSADTKSNGGTTKISLQYQFVNQLTGSPQSVTGEFDLARLDNQALPGIHRMIGDMRTRTTGVDFRDLASVHLEALHIALQQSPRIDWQQTQSSDNGAIDADLELTLAPALAAVSAGVDAFTDEVIANMKGTLDFTAPISMVEDLAVANSFVTTIRSMGMLEKNVDAGNYEMRLTYADGTAIVNGLPVPVIPTNR